MAPTSISNAAGLSIRANSRLRSRARALRNGAAAVSRHLDREEVRTSGIRRSPRIADLDRFDVVDHLLGDDL